MPVRYGNEHKQKTYNRTLQRLRHLPLGDGKLINQNFFRILRNRTRVLNAENRAYFMWVCLQFFVELNERRLLAHLVTKLSFVILKYRLVTHP